MNDIPFWALSIAYWLHMLATTVWVGGIATLVMITIPTARSQLSSQHYADLMGGLSARITPIAWLCLGVLLATGMFQMSANPNYEGVLEISNSWAKAILVKHVLFVLVIIVSAYLTWVLLPAQNRLALLRAKGKDTPEVEQLNNREKWLRAINLILAVLILGLTALARSY
jgi:uncharacterized membrane protein